MVYIYRDEHMHFKSNHYFNLKDEEQELLQIIKRKAFEEISSKLVSHVQKSLKEQPVVDVGEVNNELKEEVEMLKKKMENVLRELKSNWGK